MKPEKLAVELLVLRAACPALRFDMFRFQPRTYNFVIDIASGIIVRSEFDISAGPVV